MYDRNRHQLPDALPYPCLLYTSAYLKAHPVDIVLTDIRMPFIDGLELIEKAKSVSPSTCYVILLSLIHIFFRPKVFLQIMPLMSH